MFSVEQALAIATANLNARTKARSTAYELYYTNDTKRYEGKMQGFTVKQLIVEFAKFGGRYQYAFITRVGDDKVLRFYNRNVSKKFFSMTRKGGRRSKKQG